MVGILAEFRGPERMVHRDTERLDRVRSRPFVAPATLMDNRRARIVNSRIALREE
jgi:hypothetical protein